MAASVPSSSSSPFFTFFFSRLITVIPIEFSSIQFDSVNEFQPKHIGNDVWDVAMEKRDKKIMEMLSSN